MSQVPPPPALSIPRGGGGGGGELSFGTDNYLRAFSSQSHMDQTFASLFTRIRNEDRACVLGAKLLYTESTFSFNLSQMKSRLYDLREEIPSDYFASFFRGECEEKPFLYSPIIIPTDSPIGDTHVIVLLLDKTSKRFAVVDPNGTDDYDAVITRAMRRLRSMFRKKYLPDDWQHLIINEANACILFEAAGRIDYSDATGEGLCWLYTFFIIDTILQSRRSLLDRVRLTGRQLVSTFTAFALDLVAFRRTLIASSNVLPPFDKQLVLGFIAEGKRTYIGAENTVANLILFEFELRGGSWQNKSR